ncbi:hypothetical protein ACFW9I_36970 [[Kitasatospora] papulosa]|uniref:hypothetical protein n=1 Tax=[Kitasatospora] papulosa TaxID=1464011 RepID=UPI0036A6B6F7
MAKLSAIVVHVETEVETYIAPESVQAYAAHAAAEIKDRDDVAAERFRIATAFERRFKDFVRPERRGRGHQPDRHGAPDLEPVVRISTTPLSAHMSYEWPDARTNDEHANDDGGHRAAALARLTSQEKVSASSNSPLASSNVSGGMNKVAAAAACMPVAHGAALSSGSVPSLSGGARLPIAQRHAKRRV